MSLIFGTSYVADTLMRDNVTMWARTLRHANPGAEIVLFDSASPFDPTTFLAGLDVHVFRFGDNIGHLSKGGQDGWGRAFCAGVSHAIAHADGYAAYIDADILFAPPVASIIDKMARSMVGVACPLDLNYQFIENGIVFMDVDYMRESRFVEKYDWPNPSSVLPERRCETIWADDLFTLPLRGVRNDFGQVTHENWRHAFPYGIDYLTHCRDQTLYTRFMQEKGVTG
jgi:hypothetical protein